MKSMKYWLCFILWIPLQLGAQLLPANRYFNSNQTNAFIWDNTASNGVVNNGSGTWNTTNLTWIKSPSGANQIWVGGSSATFGGNQGIGAAGTLEVKKGQLWWNSKEIWDLTDES